MEPRHLDTCWCNTCSLKRLKLREDWEKYKLREQKEKEKEVKRLKRRKTRNINEFREAMQIFEFHAFKSKGINALKGYSDGIYCVVKLMPMTDSVIERLNELGWKFDDKHDRWYFCTNR